MGIFRFISPFFDAIMRLFNKPKCRRFFTYESKILDLGGLSAGLTSTEFADIALKSGPLKSVHEFVKVSERLMKLDFDQYTLCQDIVNIRDETLRDKMFSQLAEIKMEMMRIAANPVAFERSEINSMVVNSNPDVVKVDSTISHESQGSGSGLDSNNIIFLFDDPATIPEALKLAGKLPFKGSDRFLFNQKRQRYHAGMSDYERLNWIAEMKCFLAKYTG